LRTAAGLNGNGNYDGTENFFADSSFVRFLDHLDKKLSQKKKGLLIINGDLVDFLRIRNIPTTQHDFETWKQMQGPDDAQATWEHISRSPNHSIEKAGSLLGYSPRYTSLEAVEEAVSWLIANGQVEVPT